MNDPQTKIVFDPAKNESNIEKHGVPLTLAADILKARVATEKDIRFDYGEDRYVTAGYFEERLFIVVWTYQGDQVRAISVRKANKREVNRYEHR